MARGIDLPDVDMVISYDPASHLKTYIHRVGRTARAGQTGIAVTCLIDTQIKPFKQMLTQAGKTQIEPLEFTEKHTNPIQKKYQQALETLACGIEVNKYVRWFCCCLRVSVENQKSQQVEEFFQNKISVLFEERIATKKKKTFL